MTCYPVFIPTLHRYKHFRQCVESLSRCTYADKTELVIGLDYPPSEEYQKGNKLIKEYVNKIRGFREVTVIEHPTNLGPSGNWRYLTQYCFERYGACIGSEDDNIFSPCFLDFMNKALDKYWNDWQYLSVSGYNHVPFYDQGKYSCFGSVDSCAWGIGLWKDKEYKMKTFYEKESFQDIIHSLHKSFVLYLYYPAIYNMLSEMVIKNKYWGDVIKTSVNIIKKHKQLHPSLSLVRNCGYDGTGVNCGFDSSLENQIISESLYYDLKTTAGKYATINNIVALRFQCLSKGNELKEISGIRQQLFFNVTYKYKDHVFLLKVIKKTLFKLFIMIDNMYNSFLFMLYKKSLYK